MRTVLILVCLMVQLTALAKSFGVVGEVFPVAEMSFLTFIEERLAAFTATGELEALNQRWLKTVASHADRPSPLGLPRASISTVHYYKPEIVITEAIKDSNGRVLFPANTRVNALQQLPNYSPCWLFFNADNEAQMHWAEKYQSQCPNAKLILTGGSVGKAEKSLQMIIYFDQSGRIARKLQLSSVPALVKREGNQLRIQQLAVKENGDVT